MTLKRAYIAVLYMPFFGTKGGPLLGKRLPFTKPSAADTRLLVLNCDNKSDKPTRKQPLPTAVPAVQTT